jgi:hypothetical protein
MYVDWDEDCHGPVNTAENRLEYPDQIHWSCCDAGMGAPGCTRFRVRAK